LGIRPGVAQPAGQSRAQLAALYSAAALVLVPSEREGFGLPILEALAAGAPVLASDIPPLREVGGEAISFCPVADVEKWVATVKDLLRKPSANPSLEMRQTQARRFTWRAHAERVAGSYRRLASTR
jgi:glycosyltransferase involved in cell wall biosynthesis